MLSEGSVLRSTPGGLVAADPNAARVLKDAIASSKDRDRANGIKDLAIRLRARDGAGYVARVLPLSSTVRPGSGAGRAAAAAVFVQKASLETRSATEVIANTFDLTRSELRVLLAIIELGGVRETADALGIGQSTVKTHLHRLFRKTATSCQVELVKLVAGFANPLIG